MKKTIIASILAVSSLAASALELGVHGTRDYTGDQNTVGLSLTKRTGALGLSAGYDRTVSVANHQDRFSVGAGYDVVKVGPVTVAAKVGGTYLHNQHTVDGFAMIVGAGFTVPVTKNMNAVLDVTRQYGQDRVSSYDGNRVSLGLAYKF